MSDYKVDTIIIGAGAVGLAIAECLSKSGREVIVLESEDDFGKITSSRNSGVIHAGIYYNENSLKSKFCVKGNELLYDYCSKNNIPFENTKKLLIASSNEQISIINDIKNKAEKNGVKGIKNITKKEVINLEPLIFCKEALLIPSSGIIDPISYMRSLVGKIEDSGGMLAFNSKLINCEIKNNKFVLYVSGKDNISIQCNSLINSAGLFATDVSSKIEGLSKKFIPQIFYAKGNYFSLNKNIGIRHLIYPIPEGFGLGIHLTLELDHSIKFGPDVQWIDNPFDYSVDDKRKNQFVLEIKKYLPSIKSDLLKPSYAGIRPILNNKDKAMRDFVIQDHSIHSIPNLINLYGIESPGLTSSLAIAKYVKELLE
tara:strand:+ start:1784 stop:2893 length:1110 start_codon:yes stop_codon:yes gene_type:complete